MKRIKRSLFGLGILMTLVVVGCNSGGDSTMTQAQIDAVRHPKADPNFKGPDPAAMKRMNEEMAAYREKHKNDKVEFIK